MLNAWLRARYKFSCYCYYYSIWHIFSGVVETDKCVIIYQLYNVYLLDGSRSQSKRNPLISLIAANNATMKARVTFVKRNVFVNVNSQGKVLARVAEADRAALISGQFISGLTPIEAARRRTSDNCISDVPIYPQLVSRPVILNCLQRSDKLFELFLRHNVRLRLQLAQKNTSLASYTTT